MTRHYLTALPVVTTLPYLAFSVLLISLCTTLHHLTSYYHYTSSYQSLNMIPPVGGENPQPVCILDQSCSYLTSHPTHPINRPPITLLLFTYLRFSSDITQSDEKLASTIGWCLGVFVSMIGIIGTIAYSTNGIAFLAYILFYTDEKHFRIIFPSY